LLKKVIIQSVIILAFDVVRFYDTLSIGFSIIDRDFVFQSVSSAVEDVPELNFLVLDASDLESDLHEVFCDIEAIVQDSLYRECFVDRVDEILPEGTRFPVCCEDLAEAPFFIMGM
jgi:hypothetical protein